MYRDLSPCAADTVSGVMLGGGALTGAMGSITLSMPPFPPLFLTIAGIRTEDIRPFTARQALSNWCWAACVQTILNYHGLCVTQEEVVFRIFGNLANAPADGFEIRAALTGFGKNGRRSVKIESTTFVPNPELLIDDLADDKPILVGLRHPARPIGHAYVLSAISYTIDPFGKPVFFSVTLENPDPFSCGTEVMSWSEFVSRLMLVARVRVMPI